MTSIEVTAFIVDTFSQMIAWPWHRRIAAKARQVVDARNELGSSREFELVVLNPLPSIVPVGIDNLEP
jgi:hypothetical protein